MSRKLWTPGMETKGGAGSVGEVRSVERGIGPSLTCKA